jgi:hypothetical protein
MLIEYVSGLFCHLARLGSAILQSVLVGSLTSLPMLFSGIVFVFVAAAQERHAPARTDGALVGALPSVTFITGIKLLLIVALLYTVVDLPSTRSNSFRSQPLA